MSRTNTNRLLKDLAESFNQNPDDETFITLVAGGQVVTGQMISEDQFFDLQDNIGLKELFIDQIKDPRSEAIAKFHKDENFKIEDELKEYFIYLKKASYVNAKLRNNKDEDGLSIQVRVSDISAFSYRGYAE